MSNNKSKFITLHIRTIISYIFLLILAACKGNGLMYEYVEKTLSDAEILQFIGINEISNAQDIFMFGKSEGGNMVILRFDLPESDISDFLDCWGISSLLRENYTPFIFPDAPYSEAETWWDIPTKSDAEDHYPYSYRGLSTQIGNKSYAIVVINIDESMTRIYMLVSNR